MLPNPSCSFLPSIRVLDSKPACGRDLLTPVFKIWVVWETGEFKIIDWLVRGPLVVMTYLVLMEVTPVVAGI